jgi:hypothetical protein
MEWEEPDGRLRPFPSPAPYRCLKPTELMLILLEVVGMFVMTGLVELFMMMVGKVVMMGLVELFMMKEKKIIFLSGPGQTHISKRYRAQCSKEDVVRKTSISSEGSG